MRRTSETTIQADGGTTAAAPTFDEAYTELAAARAAYDAVHGDPERVAELATAADRLRTARRTISWLRAGGVSDNGLRARAA